jgi:hypothetical protein
MELSIEAAMRTKGMFLIDAIGSVLIFVCLLAGMHIALVKFWNKKLSELQSSRLNYDGEKEWKP